MAPAARRSLEALLASTEPSIRYKVRVGVLGENPASRKLHALREEIRRSPRVRALLAGRARDGRLLRGRNVYQKWQGAHWVMALLADLGYPPGDRTLLPLRDQLLDHWLAPQYFRDREVDTEAKSYQINGVPVMQGRHRRCASQQGNALFAVVTLGLANTRTGELVERLLHWQWPDGGWNCDRNPDADTSSFMETLTPLRGLVAHAKAGGGRRVRHAIKRAANVFLDRELFRRRSNGAVISREFVELHYPLYWHYDVLGGLKVMAEAGMIRDRRCQPALDLLQEKQLADGGFPAEKRYYKVSKRIVLGGEMVDWGGTSTRVSNPWVTADAFTVLRAAGRL